jgi:hypothetical protein
LAYTDGDEFALQMDKATILGDAVTYVRELQGKVKTLEKDSVHVHGTGGTIQSTVLVKKPCRIPDSEVATSDGSNGDDLQKLPEIEARLSDQSVLLRIHCDSARGLLVKVLSEVEMMSLVITHTNVMPYPSSTAHHHHHGKGEPSIHTHKYKKITLLYTPSGGLLFLLPLLS